MGIEIATLVVAAFAAVAAASVPFIQGVLERGNSQIAWVQQIVFPAFKEYVNQSEALILAGHAYARTQEPQADPTIAGLGNAILTEALHAHGRLMEAKRSLAPVAPGALQAAMRNLEVAADAYTTLANSSLTQPGQGHALELAASAIETASDVVVGEFRKAFKLR